MGRRTRSSSESPPPRRSRKSTRDVPAPTPDASLTAAKTLLTLLNVASFALAAALVGVGGADHVEVRASLFTLDISDPAAVSGWLMDPRHTLVVLGSLQLPLAVAGLWAGLFGARRTLLVYATALLCAAAALIYAAILCFAASESDAALGAYVQDLQVLVQAHLPFPSAAAVGFAQQASDAVAAAVTLHTAGAMCAAAAALVLLALGCASRVAGHAWLLPRVALSQNVITLILGACVIYLAALTAQGGHGALPGGLWAAKMVAAVGGFIVLVSLRGVAAMAFHWRLALVVHFATLVLLAALLAIATAALLAAGGSGIVAAASRRHSHAMAAFSQKVLGCLPAPPPPPPYCGPNSAGFQKGGRHLLAGLPCGGFGCSTTCPPAMLNSPNCGIPFANLSLYTPSAPAFVSVGFSQPNMVIGTPQTVMALAYSACAAMRAQFPGAFCNYRAVPGVFAGCNPSVTEGVYQLLFHDIAQNTRHQQFADQFTAIVRSNNSVFLHSFLARVNIGQMTTAANVTLGIGSITLSSPPPPSPPAPPESPPPARCCQCTDRFSGCDCRTPPGRRLLQTGPPVMSEEVLLRRTTGCALDAKAAWWDQHLTVLGGASAVLLVFVLFNLVATGYLLAMGKEADGEPGEKEGRPRRRRRVRDEESGSGDELMGRR